MACTTSRGSACQSARGGGGGGASGGAARAWAKRGCTITARLLQHNILIAVGDRYITLPLWSVAPTAGCRDHRCARASTTSGHQTAC